LAELARETLRRLNVLFIARYAQSPKLGSGFLDEGVEKLTKPFFVDALAIKTRDMVGHWKAPPSP